MKKMFVVLLCTAVCLISFGCKSAPVPIVQSQRVSYVGPDLVADVPAKDFTSLGIVSVRGKGVSFNDLLEEASKLGADTIINIHEEFISTSSSTSNSFTGASSSSSSRERLLTATAIKYTNAVMLPNSSATVEGGVQTGSSQQTKGKVPFLPF